jgi:hypothetical protein
MRRALRGRAAGALLALLGAASGCTTTATEAEMTRTEVNEDLAGPDAMVGESNAEANQREALEDVIDDSNR